MTKTKSVFFALFCVLFFQAGLAPASYAADQGGRIQAKNRGQEEEMRLVMMLSRMAGAESVCHPGRGVENAIRLCGEFLVARWPEVTGTAQGSDEELKLFPVVWQHGFGVGSEVQSEGRGLSCEKLDAEVLQNVVAGYCPVVKKALRGS